ncbi:recombinase family protein [Piscibacillus salipiscarius]
MEFNELQYKRCAFYVRYYNDKMKTNQLLSLMEFCHEYGILLGYSAYFEDYMNDEYTERKNFSQLIKIAKLGEIEVIVVHSSHFIDLDYNQFCSLKNELHQNNVQLITLSDIS